MQNKDETELIARSLDGDTEAYAALIDRYKNAVYYHCFAIVRDEDVAEDMAQETFIVAYYKLRRYNPKFRLSTWLFAIGTNKSLTWLKKTRHQIKPADDLQETVISDKPSPHAEAMHAELHNAVDSLQPKHRAVISLYYWQGLSYAEIATALAAPLGSVKVWMKRAKQQLKKELS